MPKYRESFDLNVMDVSLIEESLSARVSQVSRAILEHASSNPFQRECERVKGYKQELIEIRNLLGRIHNQKIWYQPRDYVPQG